VGLARAVLHLAGLEVGTALLALAAEPAAAAAAAVIFHRHVVRRGGSPVRQLVAPALLLVAIVEVWDAIGDLGFGAAHVPWSGWVVAAVALAALLVIGTIDEARRKGANAEQRFRRLSEHSKDVIAEVGSDGRVIYVSPNMRELLGYEPEDLVGRHSVEIAELVGVSAQEEIPGMTRVAELEAAGSFERTWRVRRKDGSWCWVEIHANTYVAPSGELRAIGVSRDVTERVEAEQKRRELEAEMQQAKRLESLGLLAVRGVLEESGSESAPQT
jgi:PAS domain S-box-containing protein